MTRARTVTRGFPARQRAPIERTSPTDLMQLASDLPGSPMQVAAILVLGAGQAVDLTAVRDAIDHRIHAVPRLRQRLIRAPFGGGRPVWADEPDFDIRDHVDAVDCPAPGDEKAVLDVVAGTLTRRLPRNRPLWSATVITSLSGGRAALAVTLHHVLADGLGGLAVLARLVDGASTRPDTDFPRPSPGRRALLLDAAGTRLRAVSHLPAKARPLRSAIAELTSGGVAGPPRSSLNRPIGAHRSLAGARTDLASVQRVAHAHGATVNDVVLTAVTGALHTVLRHRGENADRFVVSVPVAGRRSAGAGHLGNDVGVMTVPVTVTGDPYQRLAVIARSTRLRRPATPSASAALLGDRCSAPLRVSVSTGGSSTGSTWCPPWSPTCTARTSACPSSPLRSPRSFRYRRSPGMSRSRSRCCRTRARLSSPSRRILAAVRICRSFCRACRASWTCSPPNRHQTSRPGDNLT